MNKWNVGDIVIEQRTEGYRGSVQYTLRPIRKVGKKYVYLDFKEQGWRNETKYRIDDGIEQNQYGASTRIFKDFDDVRNITIPGYAYAVLSDRGIQFDYSRRRFSADTLLLICRALDCEEEVLKKVDEILDKVKSQMLQLEDNQNKVSL